MFFVSCGMMCAYRGLLECILVSQTEINHLRPDIDHNQLGHPFFPTWSPSLSATHRAAPALTLWRFHDETVVLCYGQEPNPSSFKKNTQIKTLMNPQFLSISSNASGTETHFGIPEKKKKHFLQEILHLWLFFPCTSGHKSLICQLISAISQSP